MPKTNPDKSDKQKVADKVNRLMTNLSRLAASAGKLDAKSRDRVLKAIGNSHERFVAQVNDPTAKPVGFSLPE